MQQPLPAQQPSSRYPKAANPTDTLNKSLRLPRTYPKVAKWLFAEPHLPFHSDAPLLTPHAFTGSAAVRVRHSFQNIGPVFDPFGVDEETTPHVFPPSQPSTVKEPQFDFIKPAGYIIDLLFTPVARAASGVIVGYSLSSGQSFDRQASHEQSGTFRGKDHLNGRFAYDMDNDHVIVVINGLTPLVSGIIDLSFLGQSRHRFFYTVPNAPYGPSRLPTRVLVMLTGLEIKINPLESDFNDPLLGVPFTSLDPALNGFSKDLPDLRLKDGFIDDDNGLNLHTNSQLTPLDTPHTSRSSHQLSKSYAEQLTEIVADLHNLAISMQGVYKGPYMRRDVFDIFDSKRVRSSINGLVAGAHLPPTRDYRRLMAIYAWQGYASWAFGIRSQRRGATLGLFQPDSQLAIEQLSHNNFKPAHIVAEEPVPDRRNAMTQTDTPQNRSNLNHHVAETLYPSSFLSPFPRNSSGSNNATNLLTPRQFGMDDDHTTNNPTTRTCFRSSVASCTAWTEAERAKATHPFEINSIDTSALASDPAIINHTPDSAESDMEPGVMADPAAVLSSMDPSTGRSSTTTAGKFSVPSAQASTSLSLGSATPLTGGIAPTSGLPPPGMSMAVPMGPATPMFMGIPASCGSVPMGSGLTPSCTPGTCGTPASSCMGNGSSPMGLCSGQVPGPLNHSTPAVGFNSAIKIPINGPIVKDCRTCHWCKGLIGRRGVTLVNDEMIQAEKLEARRRKNRESAMRSIKRRREREEQQRRELDDTKKRVVDLRTRRSKLIAENDYLRVLAASRGLTCHQSQVK